VAVGSQRAAQEGVSMPVSFLTDEQQRGAAELRRTLQHRAIPQTIESAAPLAIRHREQAFEAFCSVRMSPEACTTPSFSEPARRSKSSHCSVMILVLISLG
jgi:hypothetical protein